jgi:hypothetical protein
MTRISAASQRFVERGAIKDGSERRQPAAMNGANASRPR